MSSEIFDVVASCSNVAEEFLASMYGTVCAPHLSPISRESQLVKLRAPLALRCADTRPRYVLFDFPAAMPFEMIRLTVFLPRCSIFVPLSTCCLPLEIAIE